MKKIISCTSALLLKTMKYVSLTNGLNLGASSEDVNELIESHSEPSTNELVVNSTSTKYKMNVRKKNSKKSSRL